MRIAVMGTGAVGGYFGAKLAASGHDLAFIARGKHLDALRRDGPSNRQPKWQSRMSQCPLYASDDAIAAVDLMLFCVKSYDTEAAASPRADDRRAHADSVATKRRR